MTTSLLGVLLGAGPDVIEWETLLEIETVVEAEWLVVKLEGVYISG